MNILVKIGIVFSISSSVNSIYADDLGDLFTNSEQRIKLEKLKRTGSVIELEQAIIEPESKQEDIAMPILKGIVYRGDGKSTAWINDDNTFNGNLASQHIQIPNGGIKEDTVTVIIPGFANGIELKVGPSIQFVQ